MEYISQLRSVTRHMGSHRELRLLETNSRTEKLMKATKNVYATTQHAYVDLNDSRPIGPIYMR